MPKGGHREGAGRPPTYRRITLDQEAAQLLAQLLAEARQREPEEHWTATRLLSDLITEAWRRKIQLHMMW